MQDFWLGGGGGGGICWCINEARICERRGLGASPSLLKDLASLAMFDKFNAYAYQGCI